MTGPVYAPVFDEGYDAYQRGGNINPYLALDDPIRAMEWAHGFHTAMWEGQEPE